MCMESRTLMFKGVAIGYWILIAIEDNGVDIIGEFTGCDDVKTIQALRRLEEQLSLNDDIYQEIDSLPNQYLEYKGGICKQEQYDSLCFVQSPEYTVQEQYNGGHPGFQDHSSIFVLRDDAGIDAQHLHQSYGHGYTDGSKGPLYWQEVLETCNTSSVVESQEKPLSSSRREMAEKQEHSPWPNFNGSQVEH
ncbi:hypothetical protein Ddye_023835 [Dipteronia dyeriana]|uniref:Uncharacterized protein n=1 Tax=Dipteronia dyeriana TaxID=168575 RepID=A0AAD9TU69_9ROSI|nr:hypothetical protein Ddye_023835 [Dipteronia dyeriana]